MALVTTNKLLFCCISFFAQALCMEVVGLQSLSKDMIQHIGTQLTFVGRKNMKSSCTYMYALCNKEPLFLSPFSAENYHKIMKHSCGCLPLSRMASSDTRMRLKVYAARQNNEDMFFDLLLRDPIVCDDTVCLFTYHKNIQKKKIIKHLYLCMQKNGNIMVKAIRIILKHLCLQHKWIVGVRLICYWRKELM